MIIVGSNPLSYTRINSKKLQQYITDYSGTMLIIGQASEYSIQDACKERDWFVNLGFDWYNISVFNERYPTEHLNKTFDYITVLGGNTFKLLHDIKKYSLDSFIQAQYYRGATYIGYSAGACIACRDIEYIRPYDDNNHIFDNDFTALGLTDKYILCHYDNRSISDIRTCRSFIGAEAELITINEDQYVII